MYLDPWKTDFKNSIHKFIINIWTVRISCIFKNTFIQKSTSITCNCNIFLQKSSKSEWILPTALQQLSDRL